MEQIVLTQAEIPRVKRNLKKLAHKLDVRIFLQNEIVSVDGDAVQEYEALAAIKAIAAGFDFKSACLLQDDEYMLDEIPLMKYIKRSRLPQVKARIIGSQGRALRTIHDLSHCFLKISDNSIFVLGKTEDVEHAVRALISIAKGSRHSNVYAALEHKPVFSDDFDLQDLKDKKPYQ